VVEPGALRRGDETEVNRLSKGRDRTALDPRSVRCREGTVEMSGSSSPISERSISDRASKIDDLTLEAVDGYRECLLCGCIHDPYRR
jgi:hypothetical protein